MKKQKRLLIVGPGGFRGAYGAGVLVELYKKFKAQYFDTIIGSSIGSILSSYYLTGQLDDIQNLLRYLSPKKIINPINKLRNKDILDFDYVLGIIKSSRFKLNVGKILKSKTKLYYALTNFKTGKTEYRKPNRDNIYDLIRASCALFPLHPEVKIGNKHYIDGNFSEMLPFKSEFIKKYDKILIISNRNITTNKEKIITLLLRTLSYLTPDKIDKIIDSYLINVQLISKTNRNKNVMILEPSIKSPEKYDFDTNTKHINATFNLGVKDAKKAINFLEK
jgi:predicted patatin/cPLA2 family phospholipase